MPWRVKQGITVSHDGSQYVAGDLVPCTDDQAASMPHAVEVVGPPKATPALRAVEAPAVMVPEVPTDAFEASADTKPGKYSKRK
jgi:hypothetical protein